MFVATENVGRHIPLSAPPVVVFGGGLPILARKSARVLRKKNNINENMN
jgi:hypothetical protein